MAKKSSEATPRTPPIEDETNARENLAAFFRILMDWDAREVRPVSHVDGSANSTSGDDEKEAAHVDEDE